MRPGVRSQGNPVPPHNGRIVRRRLAEAVLSIATDNHRDVEALKRGALEIMSA